MTAGSSATVRELYVYWKLPPDSQATALARVRALHAKLIDTHPGLQARVLVRCDLSSGGLATVMEVYSRPSAAAGVDESLQRAIEATAAEVLAGLPFGPRHVEAFADLAG
jgi:hypothetical protein